MKACTWLIQVPSGHPEPDFPSDMWMEIECGAEVTIDPDGWHCTAGHEHVTYGSPRQRAAEQVAAQAELGRR